MCRWERGTISFSVQLFNNKGASWVISGECDDASWMWCVTPEEILLPYQIVFDLSHSDVEAGWIAGQGWCSHQHVTVTSLSPEGIPASVTGDNHDDMIVPGLSMSASSCSLRRCEGLEEKPGWVADGPSNNISNKILKTGHRLLQYDVLLFMCMQQTQMSGWGGRYFKQKW